MLAFRNRFEYRSGCQTYDDIPYGNESLYLKHVQYTLYLGNMHNTKILGEYNTCHLFHLVIQFCEVMKHDSISFVLKVLCQ